MKKIFVTGCNGLLGSSLIIRGSDRYAFVGISRETKPLSGLPLFTYREGDITNASRITSIIAQEKPDVIIHTAAYTDVDGCERDSSLAQKINVDGTKNVCDAAREIGARFVFLSTDYVFDGDHAPYRETDTPNPQSVYGRTKLEGERLVQELGNHGLICRTQVLYGYRPGVRKNFVLWVKESLEAGKEIRVVDDQIGSPTFADNLADMIFELVDQKAHGIYHTSGPDSLDRYHFALKIADVFGLSSDHIHPIKTSDLKQDAPRPMNSTFTLDKLRAAMTTQPMSVDEGLRAMKEQMEKIASSRIECTVISPLKVRGDKGEL